MKDCIDILDLSTEEIDDLIHTAIDMMDNPSKYADCMKGKVLATLFYEPSTRTRLSFESAVLAMGGSVIGFSGASSSSASKGESVHDTAIVVSQLADIIAIRHNKEGAPLVAAKSCDIPVINAGDGGHNHPTQTLADLCTIYREKGRLDHLKVGVCGDLRYGRTVHSLLNALQRYPGLSVVLISPEELCIPKWVKEDILEKNGIPYKEVTNLEDNLFDLDVLYMTRIQKERFDSQDNYERLKDVYVLDAEKMKKAKEDCIVLHPLPRVNEISVDVDKDPRACYFKQVYNGKYMRMALIRKLLTEQGVHVYDHEEMIDGLPAELTDVLHCTNPRCITSCEQEIHHIYRLKDPRTRTYRCIYCEAEAVYDK